MTKYIFDTNIFNNILDGNIDINQFSGLDLFVTHIQFDELMKTPISGRRDSLIAVFTLLSPTEEPTESFVIGFSRLDYAKLGDGVGYTDILQRLNEIKEKPNNACDALIGEVAYENGMILVTCDKAFYSVMNDIGCSVIHLDELINKINNP